mmetsp:Transcript_74069/g.197475  ORF Transcript_74069/g.197475 Transcript_74069/m.197475 type:complete len:326 (-) Transcript_74069:150-1127(-)
MAHPLPAFHLVPGHFPGVEVEPHVVALVVLAQVRSLEAGGVANYEKRVPLPDPLLAVTERPGPNKVLAVLQGAESSKSEASLHGQHVVRQLRSAKSNARHLQVANHVVQDLQDIISSIRCPRQCIDGLSCHPRGHGHHLLVQLHHRRRSEVGELQAGGQVEGLHLLCQGELVHPLLQLVRQVGDQLGGQQAGVAAAKLGDVGDGEQGRQLVPGLQVPHRQLAELGQDGVGDLRVPPAGVCHLSKYAGRHVLNSSLQGSKQFLRRLLSRTCLSPVFRHSQLQEHYPIHRAQRLPLAEHRGHVQGVILLLVVVDLLNVRANKRERLD